jgi:hypothetical protein
MFAGKVRACPSEAPFPLLGRLLALPTNIRQGWESLPETNTLAYYERSFITLGPGLKIRISVKFFLRFPDKIFAMNLYKNVWPGNTN